MINERILSALVYYNVCSSKECSELNDKSNILITKDQSEKIVISINVEKPLLPETYFKIRENYSTDGTVFIDVKNQFKSFDVNDVWNYLVYFLNKNIFENKMIIETVIKRKTIDIENNILYLNYLNDNEQFHLKKIINHFKKFLDESGFLFDDIECRIDKKNHEINKIKKQQQEDKLNFIKKKQTSITNDKFYKKEFKSIVDFNKTVDKIIDLIPEQQTAIIEGEIFKIDVITAKNNAQIYKIYLTDYTDSIIVKVFPKDKGITLAFLEDLKIKNWVRVKITIQIDIYDDNAISGLVNSLTKIDVPQHFVREDNSLIKRIEFITHTNMTAFEGLIDVKNLFELLNSLGHKTIAITDKSNCQSFPIAMQLSKKYGIDLIYGTQLELLNNPINIVLNTKDIDLQTCEYVIFDLETTGLSPYYDKIIEFGAIKYSKGRIVDKIQFFIDPEIDIPTHITEITKISNKDVENKDKIGTALLKIVEFFGNAILIAHNGIRFDFPFINCKLEQNQMKTLSNPIIDTMQVSRSINWTFNSHSLGSICRKWKIDYNENEAHRADVDSEFLLSVWKIMLNDLEKQGIVNLNQINTKLQNNSLYEKNRGNFITVYCLKNKFIKNFYKLISMALTDNYYNGAKIFKNILDEYRDSFLISNSPTEGDVIEKALNNTNDELKKTIEFYDFITVCPISCFLHDINRKNYSKNNLEDATRRIIEIAKKLNKKVVASSDTYYLDKHDKSIFDVYVHVKSIGGKRHRFYNSKRDNSVMPDLYYRTTPEMIEEFSFLKDGSLINEIVVDNTNEIADLFEKDIIPIKNELCTPSIPGAEEKLKEKIFEKAYEIYGQNICKEILDRINHEIASIINNGYAMIYWFSHLLVKKSIDDGYIVGSRGSVGSSIVAWLVNISEVNPLLPHYLCSNCKYIKFMEKYESGFDLPNQNCPYCNTPLIGDGHNIPFETFMGFKGDKIPDIDLNFSALYQARAHEFIRDMFGKDKVLRAGTISTVAEKTAFGYVKGYFEEINSKVKNAEIIRIASKCENVKRTTGQHPGGIVVIPKEYDVNDFTPINYPADDKSIDWYTTHFAFESLHDTILKFDILGHDNPTVLKMLTEKTGVNADDIPNFDKDVMQLFSDTSSLNFKYADIDDLIKVGTNGIPEFGTNFVKEMLLVTRPQKFSDLIRISGLSHGTNVWTGNAKDLIEEQGINISDVISCRDDIMVNLIKKGVDSLVAFKIMEDVRKGKGLKEEYIEILNQKNIEQWYIDSCLKIAYLFPKAHATAYVIMAWKIAWFKIHYPLHFYSSYLSIRRDVFDLNTIIQGKNAILEKMNDIKNRLNNPKTKLLVKNKEKELLPIYEICLEMIARGFIIKNIDLEKSLENEFLVENNYLIAPFSTIDGLGDSVSKSIVDARNKKHFISKEDLMERTKLTKTHFKILSDLGVLTHLDEDNQLTIFG